MADIREIPVGTFDSARAVELAVLVELEARWENLRNPAARAPLTTQDLHGKQKAYEIFRGKLAGYNKRYSPSHIPELLLNTPLRLSLWCRSMRELYVRVETDAQVHCPVQLVEKAFRWADKVAARLGVAGPVRPEPPTTIRAAIQHLEELSKWCEALPSTNDSGTGGQFIARWQPAEQRGEGTRGNAGELERASTAC